MGNTFNAGSDRYRRGIVVLSVYSCSLFATHLLLQDYGNREHALSGAQRFLFNRLDKYFDLKPEEISPKPQPVKVPKAISPATAPSSSSQKN